MPNLSSFSLISEKVRKLKEDQSLDTLSEAFSWFCLGLILDLNEVEIADAVTDGSMDGGIDAIYLEDRDVHIFSFKYSDTFENTSRNFPENDIATLTLTMNQIIQRTLTSDIVNELIWEQTQEIWSAFDEGTLNFHFYLVTNKQKPVAHAISRFETELRPFRFVKFHYLDQEALANKIVEKRFQKVDGKIRFIDKQYFERSDGNVRGIVASLPALDLIELIKQQNNPEEINEDCFSDNVRIYKKDNQINARILESALEESNYQFWYLNNGITIVCEECTYQPNTRSPVVELKNFQIVNGGQTSHALFEANLKDSSRLSDATILVRICETRRDNPLAEKIGETTNSQTPVTSRDLHANDHIQKKLQQEFEAMGFYYERKAGEYSDRPADRRLNNEILGQLYLSYYLARPSAAKNNKHLIFGDCYKEVFNEAEVTARKFIAPLTFFPKVLQMKKVIQSKKRRRELIDENDAFVSRAVFHILYVCQLIVTQDCLNIENLNVQDVIDRSVAFLANLTRKEAQRRGTTYTHDKFFKEIGTDQLIKNTFTIELNQQPLLTGLIT